MSIEHRIKLETLRKDLKLAIDRAAQESAAAVDQATKTYERIVAIRQTFLDLEIARLEMKEAA